MRVTRDIDLAEECVQDAFAKAMTAWVDGAPAKPGAWLTTVARNRALDLLRRQQALRRRLPLLVPDTVVLEPDEEPPGIGQPAIIPDDRLRLVFTCCHPALALEAQVALTLRLLCGLSTAEVARAFLVNEPTMAARITRAKKKIIQARIPYLVPGPEELPERIEAVLAVLHLLFTTGHTAPSGDQLVRNDLVGRARDLCRMVHLLLPTDECAGLLALVILTDARSSTRTATDGRLLLLEEQDRTKWDSQAIAEGVRLVRHAMQAEPPGKYVLQAAIAAVHAEAETWEQTDWREIVVLYGRLQERWPSPVVDLNRAIAVGMASGPQAGLNSLNALSDVPALASYAYFPAARADFLRRLGKHEEAITAYTEALSLTENSVERAFLERRLQSLRQGP